MFILYFIIKEFRRFYELLIKIYCKVHIINSNYRSDFRSNMLLVEYSTLFHLLLYSNYEYLNTLL